MPDLKEQFKKQNKIFDIYMKNASIGIVVIECNYKEIGMQICEYMHTSYCLQCVDYMDLKEGIVEYLRKIGNSENEQEKCICIYNFPTYSDSVNVVKSLNISRELLKNVIRLVFIMPTFMVNQIQRYEPNLRDYIGLFLEYNPKKQIPFQPEYDAPFEKHFRKKEKFDTTFTLYKKQKQQGDQVRRLRLYAAALINACVATKENMDKVVWPAYREAIQEIKQYASGKEKTKLEADINFLMALALSNQQFYEEAEKIFHKILIYASEKERKKDFSFLQGLEGIAFCEYGLKNYEKAEKIISEIIQLQHKQEENIVQMCKTQNNLAACYIQMEKYEQAITILEKCEKIILKSNSHRLEHELYIKKNLMICYMKTAGRDIDLHMDMWAQITERVKEIYGKKSVWYAECLLIDAWCQGILLGKYEDAIKEAELAVKIEKGILGQGAEEVEKAQEVLNMISKNYLK